MRTKSAAKPEPAPSAPPERITIQEAEEIIKSYGFKKSLVTIRNWCTRYDMGKKIGGQWVVYKGRLIDVLEGRV